MSPDHLTLLFGHLGVFLPSIFVSNHFLPALSQDVATSRDEMRAEELLSAPKVHWAAVSQETDTVSIWLHQLLGTFGICSARQVENCLDSTMSMGFSPCSRLGCPYRCWVCWSRPTSFVIKGRQTYRVNKFRVCRACLTSKVRLKSHDGSDRDLQFLGF